MERFFSGKLLLELSMGKAARELAGTTSNISVEDKSGKSILVRDNLSIGTAEG